MMPNFDPSKLDPKLLMELSELVRQLPPEKISRMQTLMHNMMAGYDVTREMEEFEKSLPPGFREKLMTLMAGQMGTAAGASAQPVESRIVSAVPDQPAGEMDIREARLTLLRAVAGGQISPEEAEKLLFKE